MLLIPLLVFLAVFTVLALVMMAAGGRSMPPERIRATLESAIKLARPAGEEIIDVRKNIASSSIPWIDRLLAQMRATPQLTRILEQADLHWTPGRVLLTAAAGWVVAAYAIYLKTRQPAAALLFALPAAAAPFLYILRKRQRRFQQFQKRLPDAIELLVTALRAGNSTIGALGIVASEAPEPIRREFRLCFDEQTYGVDLRAAMENLLARVPLPDLRIISTAILIQKESGGNLAEVLEKTSLVIRERFRLEDQIHVHSAQGRFTGWILAILPAALAMILFVVNPKYMGALFSRPAGHKMIAIAGSMNLFGLLVIRKIVRIRI
jgi:tight adherence protein B